MSTDPCWVFDNYNDAALLIDSLTASIAELESQLAEEKKDAERYRWLRRTLENSVGGGVEVNDQKLVYEQPEEGEAVRVYWYPDTPIGFYESKSDTLDEAVDAAMTSEGGK